MGQIEKLVLKLLSGSSDTNFRFDELISLLENFGFSCRKKGIHFIFFKEGIEEIINIQSLNGKAKPYQVKQIRNLITKYKLVI